MDVGEARSKPVRPVDEPLLELILGEWGGVGLLCWNKTGTVVTASDGFVELTGVPRPPRGAAIGVVWEMFRDRCETDPGRLQHAFERDDALELPVAASDAAHGRRLLRLDLRRLADGRQALLIRDVGERVAAQQRLQDRECELESVLRAVPIGIGIVQDRVFKSVNPQMCRMLGYAEAELLGQSSRCLYFSDQAFDQAGREHYATLKRTGLVESEFVLRRKNGSPINVLARLAWLNPQRPERGVTFTVVDITARKQAESKLLESEERFRQLAENIEEVFWLTTWPDNNLIYASPAVEKIWQISEQTLIEDPLAWVSSIDPDDYARVAPEFFEIEKTGGFDVEFRIRRPDGSERVIHDRGFPIYDQDGNLYRVAGIAEDITERRREKRALEESEQRARALLRAMPDLMFRLNRDGLYLDYKADRKDLLEQVAPSLVGLRIGDIAPAEFAGLVRRKIAETLESGRLQRFEYCLDIPGKGPRDWEARMVPSGDDEVIATVRDITGQKAVAARLHTLSRVVEQTPEAILLTDADFRITYLNPAFQRLFGWSLEELRGRTPDLLNAEADAEDQQSRLYRRLRSGEHVTALALNRRRDGTCFHSEYWVSPLRDEQGEIIGYMGTQRDISRRVRAERQLADSEARYRLLAEHSTDIVSQHDREGVTLYVSPACRRLLGYPPEELLGQPVYAFCNPEDAPAVRQSHLDALSSRETCRVEHRIRCKDGRFLWFETRSRVFEDPAAGSEPIVVAQARDVTDRKQAELALRDSETRYRALFEQAPVSIILVDCETRALEEFNAKAHESLGYTRAEFAALRVEDIDADRSAQGVAAHIEKILAAGRDVFTTRLCAKSGERHDVIVSVRVVELGGRRYFASVVDDITERVREEQARLSLLKEREILLDYSPALIFYKDTHNRIIRVTRSVAEKTGLPREAIEGRDTAEIYPDMAQAYYQDDLEVMRSGAAKRGIVEPLIASDGSTRWLITDKIPHRAADGTVDGIVVFSTDITELKDSELALGQSEKKYRALFERIPQGVVLQDAAGKIVDANPSAGRILGRSREDMLGLESHSPQWQCIHEDGSNYPGPSHPSMRALREGRPCAGNIMGVFNPKKNAFVWIDIDAVPLFDPGETRPYGVFTSFTDVTEARELQRALVQTQRMEAVGRLTGGIAHDFNNILGSVLGFAELAEMRNAGRDEKLDEYLGQISAAGGRARDLVRQLLIYSRGGNTDEAVPTLLAPVVNEVMKMLQPILPVNIGIELSLPPGLPNVKIDPLHLQQMLINLCLNARDAMPEGGRLHVALESVCVSGEVCRLCQEQIHGQWLALSVADTGCGIPPDQLSTVFQPFFTTKDVGQGSGMGLAVVAGLMQSYDGHVCLDSNPGHTSLRLLFHAEALVGREAPKAEVAGSVAGVGK